MSKKPRHPEFNPDMPFREVCALGGKSGTGASKRRTREQMQAAAAASHLKRWGYKPGDAKKRGSRKPKA